LLLAPRELRPGMVDALREPGKGGEHTGERPVVAAVEAGAGGHDEVLAHGKVGEDPAALGNVGDATARHLVGPGAGEVAPAHDDPARALRDVAEQAADQGRLAHAVATQQPDRATPPDAQVDPVQHMAAAV